MSLDEFTKLIAILYVFLGGILTAVFAFSQVRNKNNADAIASLTSSIVNLNAELSSLKSKYNTDMQAKDDEIEQLKEQVGELKRKIDRRRE